MSVPDRASIRSQPQVTLSPELALVDPILAERARSRLPVPDDTLARIDHLVERSRLSSLARKGTETAAGGRPSVVMASRPRPPARRDRNRSRRASMFAGGATAGALLVVALLLGVNVDLDGTPAGADSTAPTVIGEAPTATQPLSQPETPSQPTPTPAPKPPKKAPGGGEQPPADLVPRRFAWAPSAGASGYHVELFRGSKRVFSADTASPAITIPTAWTFAGRGEKLLPGDYRWYVWPVVAGRRAVEAVVQAKLVVTPD